MIRFRLAISCAVFALTLFAYSIPSTTQAAILALPACIENGSCYTCDLVGLFVSIASLILNIISGVVLFAMAFGGFMWIYAAGNTEKVQKGVQIIFGAITGLIFVLCAWVMVNVALAALIGNTDFNSVKLFGTDWETVCRNGNVPSNAVVTSCASATDGQPCTGGACTADSCSCLSAQCVNACVALNDLLTDGNTGYEASCLPEDTCRTFDASSLTQVGCATGTVCCQYKTDSQ